MKQTIPDIKPGCVLTATEANIYRLLKSGGIVCNSRYGYYTCSSLHGDVLFRDQTFRSLVKKLSCIEKRMKTQWRARATVEYYYDNPDAIEKRRLAQVAKKEREEARIQARRLKLRRKVAEDISVLFATASGDRKAVLDKVMTRVDRYNFSGK